MIFYSFFFSCSFPSDRESKKWRGGIGFVSARVSRAMEFRHANARVRVRARLPRNSHVEVVF